MNEEMKKQIEEMAEKEDAKDYSHCSDSSIVIGFRKGAQAAVKLMDERSCEVCKHYSYNEFGDPVKWCDYLTFDLHCIDPQTFSCKAWDKKDKL